MKINKISLAVTFALSTAFITSTEACTALIVGKSASTNNSVFVARNEDFGGSNNWAKLMVYRPAKTTAGGEWNLGDGLVVPMPEKLYAYSAMPDWDAKTSNEEGKYFEERGVNEFNVAISATNSADINDKAKAADPLVKGGLSEALIPSLILPQIKTAREGVELLGKYLKDYGSTEGDILYFVDEKEVWMMEIGSGHHWIAVKVPDDAYVVVANSLRIHDVDLTDENVLHSEGLYDFVEQHKLLDAPDKKSFNFAKAFGIMGKGYNVDRVWLGQKILSPSLNQEPSQAQYPLFQKPDKAIDVSMVKTVLSADYKGTVLEDKADRPIRVERQLETHVIEFRPDAPKPLQVVTWQSFGVLSESLLIPVYSTLTKFPQAYSQSDDQYDDSSAYWKFRSLTTLANVNPKEYYPFIHKAMNINQNKMYSQFNDIDKKLRTQTVEEMTANSANFSTEMLNQGFEQAKKLQSQLITDLTKVTEKEYTEKEKKAVMTLPKE
ncbi:MAG: C69 family dipeptidase [Gammaproteobacteria bacterium]|nr:C69 family dipeptidase [Gammaproteobacteria bacterium]